MTPRLRWTPRALARLDQIGKYISEHDPVAAEKTLHRLVATAMKLQERAFMGRPGRKAGTRELVVSGLPYVIVYRVLGESIDIITVFHSSQNWPAVP